MLGVFPFALFFLSTGVLLQRSKLNTNPMNNAWSKQNLAFSIKLQQQLWLGPRAQARAATATAATSPGWGRSKRAGVEVEPCWI